MNKLPPIYQKDASLGFSYIPGTMGTNIDEGERYKGKEPGVLVTMAKAIGKKYDAENSMKLSLGMWDITKILHVRDNGYPTEGGKEMVRIFHSYQGITKTLSIFPGKAGTVGWGARIEGDKLLVYCEAHNMVGIHRYLQLCLDEMILEHRLPRSKPIGD